jgi:hypothetical protein
MLAYHYPHHAFTILNINVYFFNQKNNALQLNACSFVKGCVLHQGALGELVHALEECSCELTSQ